jgi:hypothetical protein
MVRVHVGEENRLDRRGINAGGGDVREHLAGGGPEVIAGAGLDQPQTPSRIKEKRVDGRAPYRPEGFGEDAPRLFLIDVAQHVEPAVDKTVADRGDDDVADAAVRHTRDLLLRNFAHWFSSSLAAALASICASAVSRQGRAVQNRVWNRSISQAPSQLIGSFEHPFPVRWHPHYSLHRLFRFVK